MTAHATLSASKADRWATCPGSIALEPHGRQGVGSAAAREGTGLHALLEHCLVNGLDATDFVGKEYKFDDHGEGCSMEITDEQAEAVQFVLDEVTKLPGVLSTETRVCYGRAIGQPDTKAFGTTDIAVIDGTHLTIADAKFGRRFVDQVENWQMLLYAIGYVDSLEAIGDAVETITLRILQPRAGSQDREGWTITRSELDGWVAKFKAAALRVDVAKSTFSPKWVESGFSGEVAQSWAESLLKPSETACTFCPVAAFCPALAKVTDDMVAKANEVVSPEDFELVVAEVKKFDAIMLSRQLESATIVELFIEAVRSEAKLRLAEGGEVPGYKLIAGRQGNRSWVDADSAARSVAAMGLEDEQAYAPRKLKSPAQMVTALKGVLGSKAAAEDALTELTVRSPAKPSLVSSSVPGQPWVGGASEDEFEVV